MLPERGKETWCLSTGEDLHVCDSVVPLDVNDAPQAAHKEGIAFFPCLLYSLGLTSVQQGAENAGAVNGHLGLDVSLLFFLALFVSLAINVVAVRQIRLLI